jgi:hypothetical protein
MTVYRTRIRRRAGRHRTITIWERCVEVLIGMLGARL